MERTLGAFVLPRARGRRCRLGRDLMLFALKAQVGIFWFGQLHNTNDLDDVSKNAWLLAFDQ